eukprot:CAMPEP_0116085568 /NCGR_PEP_ID=MMETSP0327-20121206/4393_1 /TAXON_ID=44447 /ORGANISM="Pseudo-nitzschia delicatissima, Strain B596" /LENGTH=460 /DNA_ID=CAMNT_0003576565 /DNA_START=97 /DNA_END=1479 /DNA_ORIENTATION=+
MDGDDEIEMKDLLGHEDDKVMSSAEEGTRQRKKKKKKKQTSWKNVIPPSRMSRCLLFVILVSLFGTVFFGIEVFMYLTGNNDASESVEKEPLKGYIDDLSHLIGCKAPTMDQAKVPGTEDCYNDPCFQFENDPEKNCNWVGRQKHPEKICNKQYTADLLVRDLCPGPCDRCEKKEAPKSIAHIDGLTMDFEMTIVDGVDDRDVYCEDMKQYEVWHNTKITKSDGVMFKVIKQMEHDSNAFTQGLTYARGVLFESAGRYGRSDVRILDRETALVEKKVSMESQYFAEGLTYYKDTLIQITWKERRGFVYNITNLEQISSFSFETTVNQGWGITWDRCNDEIIVTDGSTNLHFWDPNTLKQIRKIKVTRLDGSDAKEMNEIEFWRGRVLANIWYEDVILVINPETGEVEKEYDFSTLWPKGERKRTGADVLNGISVSENADELYVTGKLWDRMFTIQLLPEL